MSRVCFKALSALRPVLVRPLTAVRPPQPVARPLRRSYRTTCQSERDAQPSTSSEIQKQGTTNGKHQKAVTRRDRSSDELSPFLGGSVASLMPPGFRRMARYMDNLQREMEDIFERVVPGSLETVSPDFGALTALTPRHLMLEVEEDEKTYRLHADVPGFKKEDVKVTLGRDNVMTVRAEKQESKDETQEGAKRTSRMYRSFFRQLRLPDNIDADKIAAETKDGVLTITVPKSEAEVHNVKEIPVA